MARPRKIKVTEVKSVADVSPEEARAGLETRAHEQGIDPEGVETPELEKLVVEAENKAKAEANQGRPATAPASRGGKKVETKFYRSLVANLQLGTGEKSARFDAYMEKYQGDERRVGYLATDSEYAQKLADADPNCEEITENEHAQATNVEKGARFIG